MISTHQTHFRAINKYSFRVILMLALAGLLSACQATGGVLADSNYTTTDPNKSSYYVYLAGPEVFLPEPIAAGIEKKAAIAKLSKENDWPFELIGLYPMDNEIPDFAPNFATGIKIYEANIALMDRADFVAANMVRFRGPSMDVGTAFEMGYMRGLNKPVFAYYESEPFYGSKESPGLYADRIAKFYPMSATDPTKDKFGQSIEDFKMADNLMMIGALTSGNGEITSSFDEVILQIAEYIQAQTNNSAQ